MLNVLLVEDETNFASVLKDYLQMNGYRVCLCMNGEEGWLAFQSQEFDLCIVDVMMPKKDGFTLANDIKTLKPDVPLIFLTARAMRNDMVKGYRLGADDYIVKPFDSELLLFKIKVILQRKGVISSGSKECYRLGKLKFHVKLRTLAAPGHSEIKLSPKESALLELLCLRQNDVLTRSEALTKIWKEDTYFTARSMDVYIVKLRKYLVSEPGIEISNLHGNGYTLMIKQDVSH